MMRAVLLASDIRMVPASARLQKLGLRRDPSVSTSATHTSMSMSRLLSLVLLATAVRGAVYTDASQLPTTTFDYVVVGGA